MYPPLSQTQALIQEKSSEKSNVYIYEKIDWLSVTFPKSVKISQITKYLPEAMIERIKSPIPVYAHAYNYGVVKLLTGHPNSGIHMIISGKPLDSLRLVYNYSLDEVFLMIKALRGKVSRIDFAVDVIGDEKFTVNEVYRRLEKNQAITRMKGSKFIGESGQIQTLYIGAMDSKSRKFRVYDKSVEQNDLTRKWVRVEYEKRRGANSSYNAYISGQKISSIIIGAVNFPSWKRWVDVMGNTMAVIPRNVLEVDGDLMNKIEWVKKSAAGAIAKIAFEQWKIGECNDIHDAEIFTTLSDSIAAKLRELMNEIIEPDAV